MDLLSKFLVSPTKIWLMSSKFSFACKDCLNIIVLHVKVQVLLSYVTTMNIVTIVTILTFLSQQTQEIITTTIIQLQPANTLE